MGVCVVVGMTDLAALQNQIKRDKDAYFEEFQLQHRHFLSELQLFQQNPSSRSKAFTDLLSFIAQIAPCYPHQLKEFPQQLCDLLEQQATVLVPETRTCIAKALILLRNRDLLSPTILLPLFFKLFRVHDKTLRNLIRGHIVADIRKVNSKKKNQKLNNMLQNFMSTMLRDSNDIAARHSIEVVIDLYRKNIWNDERTVNVLAEACLSKNTKILVSGLQFFLAKDAPKDDDDEDDKSEQVNAKLQKLLHGHSRMTKKRKSRINRYKELTQKEKKRDAYLTPNFPAIQLIHDPLGFSEKLFGALKRSTDRFEVKLMMMNLISRLIVCHKLQLINFYPWVQRYLQPHQDQVTHILCILAQSVHELVDADSILPTVRVLANNFISDRCSPNAMTVGLNSIREICLRCSFAMDDTLLQDLVQYKNYKDKGVMMAAKSLLALYRERDPTLLARKDRGRDHKAIVAKAYGEVRPADSIEGIDLLEQHEAGYLSLDSDEYEPEEEDQKVKTQKQPKTKTFSILGQLEEEELDIEDEEEAAEGENEEMKSETSEPAEPVQPIVSTRILTDADFNKINALRMKQATDPLQKRRRNEFEELHKVTEELDEGKLLTYIKKRKLTYDERLALR